MYDFCLLCFIFISVLLSVLIILQPGGNGINITHSVGGPEKLFKCSDRNYFFTYMTMLLSFLFFLFSLCLCNMNSNNFKSNPYKVSVHSILNDRDHIVVTNHEKLITKK